MEAVNPPQFSNYSDKNMNTIICSDDLEAKHSRIIFKGKNNRVVIGKNTEINVGFQFDGDNGQFIIGDNCRFIGKILLGDDCTVELGDNFQCAGHVYITAAEKTEVTIGNHCRFNANIQIRTHDSHPIFDIKSGERINPSQSIHIGNKVWLGGSVAVLKGVNIGHNSIVGLNSTVTKNIPVNCLAAGIPAVIRKRNIDWDLNGLTINPFPNYKGISKTQDYEKPSKLKNLLNKHPKLYIISKWRGNGLKNTVIYLKGYRAIKRNELFDEYYYLNNKDVSTSGLDPLIHYLYYGFKEGRNPSTQFDGKYYIKHNVDVRKSDINPLVHYALYGIKEGRKTKS